MRATGNRKPVVVFWEDEEGATLKGVNCVDDAR